MQVKSSGRNGDPAVNAEKDGKLDSKKKRKKESSHSSTAAEKRRDQPLLLEFESLFESLQVCLHFYL